MPFLLHLLAWLPLRFQEAVTAGASSPAYDFDDLIKGGPFAICLLLVVMDRLGTPGERDRLRTEVTELRAELRGLNAEIRTQITPLLGTVAAELGRVADSRVDRPRRAGDDR